MTSVDLRHSKALCCRVKVVGITAVMLSRQQAHDELYGHTVDVDASPSECLNQPKKFKTSKLHLNDLNEKISNPKSMRNPFRLSEFQSIQSAFSSAATVDIEQI